MKIVHVFHIENNYSRAFVSILDEMSDPLNHQIVFTQKVEDLDHYQNYDPISFDVKGLFFGLNQLLKNSDKVYLHFFSTGPILFYYAFFNSWFKKTSWVMWGSDVYHFKLKKHPLKKWVYERIRKILIPKFNKFLGDENDFQELKRAYKPKGEFAYISYVIPGLDQSRSTAQVSSPVHVLLGNSGDRANRHLEALDILSVYKDENIKLILPMNYGVDLDYRAEVEKKAKNLFGDKVWIIKDYLALEDYMKILEQVTIAVMNHKTQRGNGNLLKLLQLGVKVYMNDEISLYETYKKQGIFTRAVKDIDQMSFTDFIHISNVIGKENPKLVKQFYNRDRVINTWKKEIYD